MWFHLILFFSAFSHPRLLWHSHPRLPSPGSSIACRSSQVSALGTMYLYHHEQDSLSPAWGPIWRSDHSSPNLSTLCWEGKGRWNIELSLKRRFDSVWDIGMITFLGGHVKPNPLGLELWIIRIAKGSWNSSVQPFLPQMRKLQGRQLIEGHSRPGYSGF